VLFQQSRPIGSVDGVFPSTFLQKQQAVERGRSSPAHPGSTLSVSSAASTYRGSMVLHTCNDKDLASNTPVHSVPGIAKPIAAAGAEMTPSSGGERQHRESGSR
jgi:hypothetical protein